MLSEAYNNPADKENKNSKILKDGGYKLQKIISKGRKFL